MLLSVTDATVKVWFAEANNDIVPVFVMLSEIVESEVPAVIFTVPELFVAKSPLNPLTSLTLVRFRVLPEPTVIPDLLLPSIPYPAPSIDNDVPPSSPKSAPTV